MINPTDDKDLIVLKERAIAKFVELGITEAELQALGITSNATD
jgi:hypothetical protein